MVILEYMKVKRNGLLVNLHKMSQLKLYFEILDWILDDALERSHIVTKQDLRNIQQAFHLNRPERFHSNDATSVHALVQTLRG